MVEKSGEAEIESVSTALQTCLKNNVSCKNKRLSKNVTEELAEITGSFLDSLIEWWLTSHGKNRNCHPRTVESGIMGAGSQWFFFS